jgi:hypothetical protein
MSLWQRPCSDRPVGPVRCRKTRGSPRCPYSCPPVFAPGHVPDCVHSDHAPQRFLIAGRERRKGVLGVHVWVAVSELACDATGHAVCHSRRQPQCEQVAAATCKCSNVRGPDRLGRRPWRGEVARPPPQPPSRERPSSPPCGSHRAHVYARASSPRSTRGQRPCRPRSPGAGQPVGAPTPATLAISSRTRRWRTGRRPCPRPR